MAELAGLIASVAGLAGAATSVSLTLFRCASKWDSALSGLASIAADSHNLATVLDYFVTILQQHGQRISLAAIRRLGMITKRCEKTIEQLKVTAKLVEACFPRRQWLFRKEKAAEMKCSLEAFKSNISLIIQTVMLAKSLDDDVA